MSTTLSKNKKHITFSSLFDSNLMLKDFTLLPMKSKKKKKIILYI